MRTKLLAWVLVAMSVCNAYSVQAQQTKKILSQAKSETTVSNLTADDNEALYAMPAVLSNIGIHTSENIPVCNYLVRHKSINGGAFLWAPYDTSVRYFDLSTGNPTAWEWMVPGATSTSQTSQNAEAVYTTEGIFDMPTLTVTTANGKSSYTPSMSMTSAGGNEKVKVGGTAEVTTADMRIAARMFDPVTSICYPSNATYALGTMTYEDNGGYVGGTNNRGVVGWGNLYMFGHDELELTGVNVYFHHKPTKYAEDAKLTLNVWVPLVTESSISFTLNPNTAGYPIESATIKYSDIKADGEDGAWSLTTEGAVANITFPNPIDLYGKPYIFISIDGFSQDPTTDDLCLLTDLKGIALDEVLQANLLAHNSFGRMVGEADYMRPIASYGGGNGSFMICPVVRSYHSPTSGINDVVATANNLKAHFDGAQLVVESDAADVLSLYNLSGCLVMQQRINAGTTTIVASSLPSGIYFAKTANGEAVKIQK